MGKFVLHVPKWKGELFFSEEMLIFLGVIVLLIVGTLFCFWGYKYFRTILFMGIGTVICCFSYFCVAPMTKNLAVRMFLTVSLTFLGVCLVYFLDIIFCYVLDKLRIRSVLGKCSYLLAAPLGAAILGLTIYCFIWRDEITVAVFAAVCLVVGLIFQHAKRKKQVRFRSYNDLMKMERPADDEDGVGVEEPAVVEIEEKTEPECEESAEAEESAAAVPTEITEPEPKTVTPVDTGEKAETGKQKLTASPKTAKVVVKEKTAGKQIAMQKKLVWGVAMVVIGLGVFLMSRASKGRD